MISIDGRAIGRDQPPYVIAELSANHNGDLARAYQVMEAASEAGADAIKLQTYTADTMTIPCDRKEFRIKWGLWAGYTLYDLYQEAATPWEWHKQLFKKGKELGITVFSTPFDFSAVDFLEEFDVPVYKIASFEATHLPLIAYIARKNKPIILSTGMANEEEIAEAVSVARDNGCHDLLLLHCVSSYPAKPEEYNLNTMADMRSRFGVEVGLSDHTLGSAVSIAAVSLGAVAIEKHVTIRRSDGGPDSAFSLEPAELKGLVESCHTAKTALGSVSYEQTKDEIENIQFRRSIFATSDIRKGERFDETNVRIIRPGHGLAPKYWNDVIGKCARKNIEAGVPLGWDHVENPDTQSR